MSVQRATGAAVVGALALVVAGCGGDGGSKSSGGNGGGGQTTLAGVKANDHGSKTVGNETKVELDDYYFDPSVLKGTPGQRVALELENEGKVEHNFSVPSQNIDVNLAPGKEMKVTVTIPKAGVVSFVCRFHRGMGMAGALATRGTNDVSGGGTSGGTGTSTGGGGYSYRP